MNRRNFLRTATAAAIFAPDIPAMLARAAAVTHSMPADGRMLWQLDWSDIKIGDGGMSISGIYRVRSKYQSVIIYPYIERIKHTVVTKDYWLPKEVLR